MRLWNALKFRLRSVNERKALNAEFDEELNFHIDRETLENIRRGMTDSEARRVALAQFGGIERFKEGLRDQHGVRWLDDLSSDVRHGVRLLRTNALFSAAVIGTLALGIGATSTIFTIVNGVLLQSLPYPEPDRIVSVSESRNGNDQGSIGQRAYSIWNKDARSFSSMAVYTYTSATLTGSGEPIEIAGLQTSASFFTVLNARALLGRTYAPEEDVAGTPRVIVLSHQLWKNTFGGDSGILNRAIVLNGNAVTVIGVMPLEFGAPWSAKYWVPIRLTDSSDSEYFVEVIARLRPGIASVSALKDLESLQPHVAALRRGSSRDRKPVVMSLHERRFGAVEKPLAILLSAVVVLLLVACANVAGLTLARSASRQREFAVRLALGAGRWRLVRQLLVESSLLAAIGGVIGTLIPVWLVPVFIKLSPSSVAGIADIHVDGSVLAFTAAVTIAVALLFGLAPALTGSRVDAGSLATTSTRNANARAHNTFRSALIVFEVSAALVLLTGAGLLTKSFVQVMAVNPGFNAENVLAASFSLPRARYPNSRTVRDFYEQLSRRVATLPGVEAVSASSIRPLRGSGMTAELPRSAQDSTKLNVSLVEVDGQYGSAARLHLLSGRFIDQSDVEGAPLAAMISVAAARHFFPGQNAVGQRLPHISAYGDGVSRLLVVGVVEDVLQTGLDVAPVAQILVAHAQVGDSPRQLIVRTSIEQTVLARAIKRFVADIDPLQPIPEITSLQEDLARSVAPRRFNSLLINAFAALALLLAIMGLYGLLAYNVASRTRELGIRMALGARSTSVMSLVLRQGMSLVAFGVVIGTTLSLALSRTVASLLYNTPANDTTIFTLAAVSLCVVALLACYIPARRATLISPTTALRQD